MIEDINIRVLPHEAASDKAIVNAVSKAMHIESKCVNQWKIIRRSIDARQRQVIVNLTVRVAHGDDKCIPINAQHTLYKSVANAKHHIIIIGAGNHIEIWDKASYEEKENNMDFADIEAAMEELEF